MIPGIFPDISDGEVGNDGAIIPASSLCWIPDLWNHSMWARSAMVKLHRRGKEEFLRALA